MMFSFKTPRMTNKIILHKHWIDSSSNNNNKKEEHQTENSSTH